METDKLLEDLSERARLHAGYFLPDGWKEIVASCHKDLIELAPTYAVYQVKEKFGGLRFYADPPENFSDEGRQRFRDRIREAEKLSFKTCQICGAEGTLVVTGYTWETVCLNHRTPDSKEQQKHFGEWS